MTEEERDYRLGLRAVVLEEFVMSFLNLPHLVALPAKGLAFLLYYLPYPWYVNTLTFPFRRQFSSGMHNFFQSTFAPFQSISAFIFSHYKPEYQWSFYSVQLNLVLQLTLLATSVLEVLTWITVHADLIMIKVLSGFVYYPLNIPNRNVNLRPPRGLRLLQAMQVIWMLIHVVVRTVLGFAPFVMCLMYSDYSVIGCVVGPFFVNVGWYVLIYANLSTLYAILDYFPYYTPLVTISSVATIAGHRAYGFSSAIVASINSAFSRVYVLIVNGISNFLLAILNVRPI
jgi:hypothetical protein